MRLTDEQWAVVSPLIPNKRRCDGKGRPRVAARLIVEAVLWILWTGAQWRALPGEYPPYQTVHRRFQEWVREKIFTKVLRALAEDLRIRGKLDLTEAFIDGTYVGAKRGALSSEKHAVEKQPESWQWQTARVFRSPLGLRVVRDMRRSLLLKHSASASYAPTSCV